MEGGADVEVQDNEPLVMVLFWSIKNIKRKRSIVRDSKASGKSFQKYVDKLSKEKPKLK
jgi:hypothetical protein